MLELASYGIDPVRERESLRADLAEVVTLADLNLDWRSLTPNERDAGPVGATFRIAPA